MPLLSPRDLASTIPPRDEEGAALASDPAIAPIVEARLGEVPASIRGTWSELPR
jgi:hypothetical protein